MHYTYKTKDTCCSEINFDIENGIVSNIVFTGGCNGNLKMISKLLDGKSAEYIIENCKGNLCGRRPTSCSDQLAIAVEKAHKKER